MQKGFAPIFIVLIVAAVILGGGVLYYAKFLKKPVQVACTMEAKQCPDGSYVGRTGPNCEFAECPEPVEGRVVPTSTSVQSSATSSVDISTAHSTDSTGSPQASSGQVSVSTETWKTYKNIKYGFRFMYPPDNAPVISAGDEGYTFKDGGAVLVIKPELIDERISTWLDENLKNYLLNPTAAIRKDITVDGKLAIKITASQPATDGSSAYKLYVIQPGNYLLVITESAPSALFDAVFSTLSFAP